MPVAGWGDQRRMDKEAQESRQEALVGVGQSVPKAVWTAGRGQTVVRLRR